MNSWIIVISFVLLATILEAVYEALATKRKFVASEMVELAHKMMIIAVCMSGVFYLGNFVELFIGFWLVRFMIFDLVWNITMKALGSDISIWYYGDTKLYDRTMKKLTSWGWFIKIVLGIVGISLLV